jgi:hypothetical protein
MLHQVLERLSEYLHQPSVQRAADRRRHCRLHVNQTVRLVLPSDPSAWFTGSVTDCSESGLGLLSTAPAACGEAILVEWDSGYFVGAVRNCHPEEGKGWRLGVELEPVCTRGVLLSTLKQTAE